MLSGEPGKVWRGIGRLCPLKNRAKSVVDVSKVPADCQESDETEYLFSFMGKGIAMKDNGRNALKYRWLRVFGHVCLSRKMEWHKGC